MESSSELEYELILVHELDYLSDEELIKIQGELVEVRKMLNTFIQRLKANN